MFFFVCLFVFFFLVYYYFLFFLRLHLIILPYRLHNDHSMEPVAYITDDLDLPTWEPQWGPISFAPMSASSGIDRVDRSDNRCAEEASWTELLI